MVYFFIFVLGLVGGSFLNSLVYSLEEEESVGRTHSRCPKCGHELNVFDLVPLLSFLFLGGRCRYCGKRISLQYPLVEAGTGFLFLILYLKLAPFSFNFLSLLPFLIHILIGLCLVVVFIYDLKHRLVPEIVVFSALFLVIVLNLLYVLNGKMNRLGFTELIVSGLGAAGFFLLLHLVSKGKWMGFGDVEIALLMGFYLGFPEILLAVFSASFLGACAGLVLIILGKKGFGSRLAFGPFLVAGIYTSFFFSGHLLSLCFKFLSNLI